MDHLFKLGHRRITHLTEDQAVTSPGSGTPHAVRLETYLACMTEAGLDDLIDYTSRGPGQDGARRAGRELLENAKPPTAILAGHDDIAMGVLAAIADTGRSRTDVSVIGYDNTDLAAHPLIDLTSVDQAGVDMGAQAATDAHGETRGKD